MFMMATNIRAQKKQVNPNGYNKFYYPNGQISSEGMMRNGKPDGYWITYYVIRDISGRKSYMSMIKKKDWHTIIIRQAN